MFRFKEFTIHQDRTAMKVCTDACVLGAYADVAETTSAPVRILDIGTGTGLLALMAAQRNPLALVDAVEVDEAAFGQASANVANSQFNGRVRVWHGRIQDFVPSPPAPLLRGEGSRPSGNFPPSPLGRGAGGEGSYDRILTNPPFYTNHLRSPDAAVNRALHTDDLPVEELIVAVIRLLKPNGQWWVLLPPYETGNLIELAATSNLAPFYQLHLRHNDRKPVFRTITGFNYNRQATVSFTLSIHESDGNAYTQAFRALLRDFYLLF